MKEDEQVSESQLLFWIHNEIEESLTLEYKGALSLSKRNSECSNEISKDVSAMANSAGGIIVYGMNEVNHLPKSLQGLDPNSISKEWLEQVINSKIQPRIDGLKIIPVPLNISDPGKVAYVVSIPPSPRAPHMAANNKYHKRFNFQSVAMYDYEVRDTLRRQTVPKLALFASSPGEVMKLIEDESGQYYISELNLVVRNSLNVSADRFNMRLFTPDSIKLNIQNWLGSEGLSYSYRGQVFPVRTYVSQYGPKNIDPVFGEIGSIIEKGSIRLDARANMHIVGWEIHVPAAVVSKGVLVLSTNGAILKVESKEDED
jgi:hypothetical protein